MKPRVFFDTDVILDVLLKRDGFSPILEILQKGVDMEIETCTSILTMSSISSFIQKQSIKSTTPILNQIMSLMEILEMDENQFRDAVELSGPSIEAKLQIVCAVRSKCTHIVTRRSSLYRIGKDDYYYWNLPAIVSPEQL